MCKIKDKLLDFEGTDVSDKMLLDKKLSEISCLLQDRYNENIHVGVHEARLELSGFTMDTGKPMELILILREKEVKL